MLLPTHTQFADSEPGEHSPKRGPAYFGPYKSLDKRSRTNEHGDPISWLQGQALDQPLGLSLPWSQSQRGSLNQFSRLGSPDMNVQAEGMLSLWGSIRESGFIMTIHGMGMGLPF